MKEHQGIMASEFQPIKQKYFLHEKEQLRQDSFVESLQEYFKIFRRRIILHILLSFFFLALMIPSILLQADFIELDVSEREGIFIMEQTWDPPISIQMFSKTDILLLDVQLFLDGKEIEEFTIYEHLYIVKLLIILDFQINRIAFLIRSLKQFNYLIQTTVLVNLFFNEVAVRLMAQFNFVPTSYLIIIVVMLVISLLYSILTYARYKKL